MPKFLQANHRHSLPLAALANGWLIRLAKTRNEKYVKNAQIASAAAAAAHTLHTDYELVVVACAAVVVFVCFVFVDFAAHLWVGVASASALALGVAVSMQPRRRRMCNAEEKLFWPGPFGLAPRHPAHLAACHLCVCYILSDSSHTHAVNTTV